MNDKTSSELLTYTQTGNTHEKNDALAELAYRAELAEYIAGIASYIKSGGDHPLNPPPNP